MVAPTLLALAATACNGSSSADAGPDGSGGDAVACMQGAVPSDPNATARTNCMYMAGAHVADTIGDMSAARAAIQTVIVVMQENHSLDHMFGTTGHGIEGFPSTYTNPGANGPIAPFHLSNTCPPDFPHQWTDIHAEWDNGAMDGFAANTMTAMGYFTDADHPFYTWMVTTFATSDRFFCSVLGGTWPNRDYLYDGTADGVRVTGVGVPSTMSVFDQLDAAHVTWGDYVASGNSPLEGALGWSYTHANVHVINTFPDDFLALVDAGTLPSVVFIDAGQNTTDEHPPANLNDGEGYVRSLLQHAFHSPLWAHMAIFYTYDEAGGFFDHVAPPTACIAAPNESDVDHLGIRVPVAVVSPYARPAYVSHNTHSHTSILRFIQALYDLPALTNRDANSDAMLDMFDFTCAAFANPPATVPASGTNGC